MSFQTCKMFFHFQNANKFFFFIKSGAIWPCIDNNAADMFKAQKGSKNIIKIDHVTSVVQP